jgi:hypothetical protein
MPMTILTANAQRMKAQRTGGAGPVSATRPMPLALRPASRITPRPGVRSGPTFQFSFDPNSIVDVQVQTVQAPTPNTYQQTGCFVSFGGTTIATSNMEELTQASDLDAFVNGPEGIATMTWTAGVVSVSTLSPMVPGYTAGDTPNMSISGCTPAGYNYTGAVTIVDDSTFHYPVSTDPGLSTVVGTFQTQTSIELSQMVATYFAQGNMSSVWVLELGQGSTITANAASLQTFLSANDRLFCGYLLPRKCGASSVNIDAFKPIFAQYQHPEAMTYFWLTVTSATQTVLDNTFKCVIQFVEAPSVTDPTKGNLGDPDGEFSCAAMFYNAVAFKPSSINPVAPMAFKYLYGVTAYPTQNLGPVLKSFKASFTNYVATGAEGGIAYTIVYEGCTKDGNDYFNWWWTIDWVQININLNLSNAVVNGSNNALAPLYYNQGGIDFLETVLYGTMYTASIFGMVLGRLSMTQMDSPELINQINAGTFAGQCNVNAVPFTPYSLANPGHYKIGEYDGLSVLFIPARGFIHILVNVVASSLISL